MGSLFSKLFSNRNKCFFSLLRVNNKPQGDLCLEMKVLETVKKKKR